MDKILNGLYRLGSSQYPAFLVVGSRRIVQFDAGPAFMGPVYLNEIRQLLGKGSGPDFLFHTHCHFDHVGSTPFLRRHFPEIKLGGSQKFAKRLSQTSTCKNIMDLNRMLVPKHNKDSSLIPEDFDYGMLIVERVLKDGERIDLCGVTAVEVIATPGHTSDSLSFFLPHLDTVLAGDALGIIPGDDFRVAPQFLSSYEDYLDSIERVRMKAPTNIVLGHHSVLSKTECGQFFSAAAADCKDFRKMIEQYLQDAQMKEEEVVRRIRADGYYRLRGGKQPEAAFLLNLTAQVRLIAKSMK